MLLIPIRWAAVRIFLWILSTVLSLHFPSSEPFYPGDFPALKQGKRSLIPAEWPPFTCFTFQQPLDEVVDVDLTLGHDGTPKVEDGLEAEEVSEQGVAVVGRGGGEAAVHLSTAIF